MKNIHIIHILFFCFALVSVSSCSDFLDTDPQSKLKPEQVDDPEKLVTAAYAWLANDRPANMWSWGDVRSDDCYKGGGGENDGYGLHCYEISTGIMTDFGEADGFWFNMYCGISRANAALSVLSKMNESDFPNKNVRMGEMRFLRGHYYFQLKIVFKHVPYIDETIPEEEYKNISNVALSNDELWQKIADDFKFAYDNLPPKQSQIGRVNQYAAAAYLAKTKLYKAYRQDDMNNVIDMNEEDLEDVLTYTNIVMGSGYDLERDFGYNFLPGSYENGVESVFAIQFSHNDETLFGRLNFADFVNAPQGIGCCDFHKPSYNLVNSFKTFKGLPYDSNNLTNYTKADNADPRLFHTVAMDGLPYKYNPDLLFQNSWNRNPIYGVYSSLKENVDPSCDCFINLTPYTANSKNKIIIRYADVLLMRAEALVELNRHGEALPLINQIRQRAMDSMNGLVNYDPEIKPKMSISLYEGGAGWTKATAQKALRSERRLEFAMEDMRFFDLVRWGIADNVINDFYSSEAKRVSYYGGARFTKNKNEYIPIPQAQIGYSKNLYKQNYGWE